MSKANDFRPEPTARELQLEQENAELKIRLQELDDTIASIHSGDVDALVVSDAIYTLDSANIAANRLRQDVLSQMEEIVFAFDGDDHIIYLNAAAERRYEVSADQVLGRHRAEAFEETIFAGPEGFADTASLRTHRLTNGTEMHVESVASTLRDSAGLPIGTLTVVRDVTQRLNSEARRVALLDLGDRLRDLSDPAEIELAAASMIGETLHASRVGYGVLDGQTDTVIVEQNWTASGVESLVGRVPLRDYGSFIEELKLGKLTVIRDARTDPSTAVASDKFAEKSALAFVNVPLIEHGKLVALLFVNARLPRLWTTEEVRFIKDVADRVRVSTERARSAAALRASERRLREVNEGLEATIEARTRALMSAEEALRQAQKMEAVGQLTGGLAHDFNNLLAGMSASLQLLQLRLKQERYEGLERYITMGQEAVRRAAALTQRLLAFARRQTLDPKPTNVNRLVASMEDLIRRTVGTEIELEVVGAGGLWSTQIDASQLENSLLNLCINGRDAMFPAGGRLTIETANKWLDERGAAERDLTPGQYISICVTDTGTGIPPDVINRVFEPFFTTKPLGQGTGLGLSMVYGFVRQSGGQIRIYSEVGQGTTMCLYLPRYIGEVGDAAELAEPKSIENGDGQTVLIVEDEETIRLLLVEVLVDAGYLTLTAKDGSSALRVLQSPNRIDLMVTDVGLPGGMNGRQVADAARVARKDLKVLFITGYAENAAVGNGHLEHGMEILTKPFDIASLARRVHAMIGS
jgi:PAS domain S-box-containing protein